MRKHLTGMVAAVLAVALLAGCSMGGASSSAQPTETPAATAVPETTLTGAVADGSDANTLYLAENGNTYAFSLAGAAVQGDATDVGADCTLVYSGTMDVTAEVQPVTVVSVVISSPAGGMAYVSGTVSDLSSMNALAVMADDGHLYFFEPGDATIEGAGAYAGNTITVTFEGALDDSTTNVQNVTVVEIVTGGSASDTSTTQAADVDTSVTRFISGRISSDSSMNVLTLNAYDGYTYTFGIEDVSDITGIGIAGGNNCTVAYKGTLNPNATDMQGVTVLRIATSAFSTGAAANNATVNNQPAAGDDNARVERPDNVLVGVVGSGSSMSILEVSGDDGYTYTFPMTGFSVSGGIIVGNRVSVHYDGVLTAGGQQDVAVSYVVVG